MCSQEVHGLKDVESIQEGFHEEFQEQLARLDDGTYTTMETRPPASTNKQEASPDKANKHNTEVGEVWEAG
ncbi:hypothetical protein QZH41_006022 [Actinostola sp. cb2023]|nr:hypothetical protein QZH41_006022 [Actinostola sp. cb2023]